MKTVYDERHGGPWDRGNSDSYYRRPFSPHYFKGASYSSEQVGIKDMTVEEIVAYSAGTKHNEDHGDFKNWN